MKNQVTFQVEGKYALFTDPATKLGGEKCTYQIPTYEALKGIIKSVYWKPTIIWCIDELRVIRPIRMQSKNVKPLKYNDASKNELSTYTYLVDVIYEIKAHFVWNQHREDLKDDRNEGKHFNMAKRMIKKGGRRDVCLGARECQAYVTPIDSLDSKTGFSTAVGEYDSVEELAFGLMFHSFDYPDETGINKLNANFDIPVMKKGIIKFPQPDECLHKKFIREMIPNPPKSVGLNEPAIQNELA